MKTMIIAMLMLFIAGAEVANAQHRKVVVVHHRVVHHHRPVHHHVVVVHHR